MNAMFYLTITKMKATVRNIFSNAVSGIFTFVGVLLFLFTFVIFFQAQEEMAAQMGAMVNVQNMHMLVSVYIGVIFFFMGFMLFQKRTALMFKADAYYIFTGPFDRKTILNYIAFDNARGGVLYALFATWYMSLFAAGIEGVTFSFLVLTFVQSVIMLFAILSLITYFYLLEVTNPQAKKIKWGIILVIVVYVLALFAKSFLASPDNLMVAVQNFTADNLFCLIPLFGFAKYGLMEYVQGNILGLIISLVLNLGICAFLIYLIRHIKGQFVEQVVEDAEWAESLRKSAKEGKTKGELNGKIHEVKNFKMGSGAAAISSKIMLELQKSRSFVRPQEAFLMLFYLAIAYFIGMDFTFFQYYILIILLASASNEYIVTELKRPYIYLIPDKAGKKMIHLVTPMALKMLLVVFFGLTCGFVVFRPSFVAYISALFNITSYGIMFTAGSIWSLRLLKSGNNVVAEQLIKMGVILVASIPAIIVSLIIYAIWQETMSMDTLMAVVSVASVISNMAVGMLLIYSARSILNGAEVMSD